MPRLPSFRSPALAELLRQLVYAPSEARCRQMDAAEALAREIDPALEYPLDFIEYRITGYKRDSGSEPLTLSGSALLPDLVVLVERLSRSAQIAGDYRGRRALALDSVCGQLGIAPKTLQRYRRRGLVCHYACGPDGRPRLVCFADALERFLAAHPAQVQRAASFSRVEEAVRRRIVEQAAELSRREGVSLNEAARRLALEHGRAHETVRGILRRHDRRTTEPIFDERGPLNERDRRVIFRAWCAGVSPADLARRFAKTPAAITRVIGRARAERLAEFDLTRVELPTFSLPDAEAVILSSPAALRDLDDHRLSSDVLALLERPRVAEVVPEDVEDALLAAYNLLKRRARAAVDALPAYPAGTFLDPVETDLRWAACLMRRLVGLALPVALGRIEQNLHRRLLDMPAETILALLRRGLAVAVHVVQTIEPARGQRLERMSSFAMDRALAARPSAEAGGRAAARHQSGSIRLEARDLCFSAWEPWLFPPQGVRERVDELGDAAATSAVRLRYGWSGERPLTIAAIAERLSLSPAAAARCLRRAERALVRARAEPYGIRNTEGTEDTEKS